MIDISPKALRFARLIAEQQPTFSSDPQIDVIKQDEESFRRKDSRERVGHHVKISERTADFCLQAVTAFLEQPNWSDASEWDGNDFAFLQAAANSLRDQLMPQNAQTL